MADKPKDLADYAKGMDVSKEELKAALRKYGMDENDLVNVQKRTLLAQAIDQKWTRDQFKASYDVNVAESADFNWEQILDQYGYSLGVLREFKDDLKPIFKWLAGQLQKGETVANLQAEFERRLSKTEFGNRTANQIDADKARYGLEKKDFRERWRELSTQVRRWATDRYGEQVSNALGDGVARSVALQLLQDNYSSLAAQGSGDDDLFERALKPYITKDFEKDPERDGPGNPEVPGTPDLSGSQGSYRSMLLAWLSNNGVTMLTDRVNDYVLKLTDGKMTMEAAKQDIRNTVFTRQYSGYADLFSKGTDIADIALDYRQTAANLLEKPLEAMPIDNEYVKRAMQNTGADGKPAPLAMYDFERILRESPEWDKTDNAMRTYTDIGETILRNFGFRG